MLDFFLIHGWSTLKKLIWLKAAALSKGILKTVTGNPIHILDALAKPAQALSVKLEPIQDLHGYDNPWPAGGGVNKLPNSLAETKTDNGITVVSDGKGTYKVTGTATALAQCSFDLVGEYTFPDSIWQGGSGCLYLNNSVSDNNVDLEFWEGNTRVDFWKATQVNRISSNYSAMSGKATNKVNISVQSGAVVNITLSPMISDNGRSDNVFSPYSNLCPISGHTDADVTRTGKNLIPTPVAANAIKYNGGGLSVADVTNGVAVTGQANGSSHSVGFILLDADYFIGKTLTFSLAMVGSNSLPRAVVMYCDADFANRSVVHVLNDTGSITFTVPSTAKGKKIGLGLFSTSGQDSLSAVSTYTDIQLELGSTATAYEPYQGQTYTIDLDGTRYGGTLDVTQGKLTVDRASVDMGSLAWYANGAISGGTQYAVSITDKKPGETNFICSAYKTSTPNAGLGLICGRATTSVVACNATQTELADFKAAVAGQTIVYELATPIEITLTPTQIDMLLGENNLWADAGDLTLTYYADGNASDEEALNILLGGRYVNNHGEDEPTDREALDILLGNTR